LSEFHQIYKYGAVGDKGELLDLEVKWSKTKVMIGSNIVRKGTLGIFKVIVSKVRVTDNLSG